MKVGNYTYLRLGLLFSYSFGSIWEEERKRQLKSSSVLWVYKECLNLKVSGIQINNKWKDRMYGMGLLAASVE